MLLFRSICLLTLSAVLAWGRPSFAAWQEKADQPTNEDTSSTSQEEKPDSQESDDADAKENEEPTANDIMRDAQTKASDGDLDGAIALIEKAKSLEPDEPRIGLILIRAMQARASELINDDKRLDANPYFYKSAVLVRELNGDAAKMFGRDAGAVIYKEASAFAVDGNTEKALASLNEAIERGYEEFEAMRNDPDFESLRKNSAFVALLEKHEKRILEEMLAKTKTELEDFKTFDFSFKLKNLDGKEISLEDYKGKIVIVDFWGTWCPPCVAEIPHFIKLKESYGEQGIEIVGLAYEQAEDTEEAIEAALKGVKDFVAENKLNYTCAIGDDETQERVPDFGAFPTTLFIDREGVVRLQLVGFHPYAKLEMVVQHLLGKGK